MAFDSDSVGSIQDDPLVFKASIHTLDPARPRADLMRIRRGVIDELETNADRSTHVSAHASAQVGRLELFDRSIVPGFHDCHLHLSWLARVLSTQIDLLGCGSIGEILDRLRAASVSKSLSGSTRDAGWIVGHGFDQQQLVEGRFPTRIDLDRLSPHRPVFVTRVCGHAAVANTAAIGALSPDDRAAGDESSGLYLENAVGALHRAVPAQDDADIDASLLDAMRLALSSGITSAQTMLDRPEQLRALARLKSRLGRLPIRVTAHPMEAQADSLHDHGILTGFGDEWLRIGAIKFFADGSLGARTAWLTRPYADDPAAVGIRLYEGDRLARRVADVHRRGFQVAIHAIGDAALDQAIDAIERALDGADNREHRHRIEHASVCRPDQIERLARLNIPVAIQPQFVTSDTWTADRLGPDRLAWAYPFAKLVSAGVRVGLSSDAPVETLDARACLCAAIERHPWSPSQCLSLEQALRAYCVDSPYLARSGSSIGTLVPGSKADFIVLDGPLGWPTPPLRDVYVGGVRVLSHT
jgi:hypothetical protein